MERENDLLAQASQVASERAELRKYKDKFVQDLREICKDLGPLLGTLTCPNGEVAYRITGVDWTDGRLYFNPSDGQIYGADPSLFRGLRLKPLTIFSDGSVPSEKDLDYFRGLVTAYVGSVLETKGEGEHHA